MKLTDIRRTTHPFASQDLRSTLPPPFCNLQDLKTSTLRPLPAKYEPQENSPALHKIVNFLCGNEGCNSTPSPSLLGRQLLTSMSKKIFGSNKFVVLTSGAEAVDTALKIAQKWGYMSKITLEGECYTAACYYGFTLLTVLLASKKSYIFSS